MNYIFIPLCLVLAGVFLDAERKKKYVRVDEGAALYSMGTHSFRELARDAKAVVKVKGILLIDNIKRMQLMGWMSTRLIQKSSGKI